MAMSTRNLDAVFAPGSVVIAGATTRAGSIGAQVTRNVAETFKGRLYGVNPRRPQIAGVEILFPVEANSVFVRFPAPIAEGLRSAGWVFYNFIGAGGQRLMCNWSTTDEDVDELLADVGRFGA